MKPITEGQVSAAMAKHSLARIEVSIYTTMGRKVSVIARAFPASWHPKVKERREAEFAKHGDGLSLSEATKITEETMKSVNSFAAPTIDDALRGLLDLLK